MIKQQHRGMGSSFRSDGAISALQEEKKNTDCLPRSCLPCLSISNFFFQTFMCALWEVVLSLALQKFVFCLTCVIRLPAGSRLPLLCTLTWPCYATCVWAWLPPSVLLASGAWLKEPCSVEIGTDCIYSLGWHLHPGRCSYQDPCSIPRVLRQVCDSSLCLTTDHHTTSLLSYC